MRFEGEVKYILTSLVPDPISQNFKNNSNGVHPGEVPFN